MDGYGSEPDLWGPKPSGKTTANLQGRKKETTAKKEGGKGPLTLCGGKLLQNERGPGGEKHGGENMLGVQGQRAIYRYLKRWVEGKKDPLIKTQYII